MSANRYIRVVDDPIRPDGGVVWNRLHSEREDICAALLKPLSGGENGSIPERKEGAVDTARWHLNLLQARLRKVDDALDRVMSGSYGNCSKCGKWIEDTKLEFDPAIAFCLRCWELERAH
jgi:hypothetical protein